MKTIEQLLQLNNNPYYKFTNDEKAVLDDFLAKKRDSDLKKSQKTSSPTSSDASDVRVRNLVPKVIDRVQDAPEHTDAS